MDTPQGQAPCRPWVCPGQLGGPHTGPHTAAWWATGSGTWQWSEEQERGSKLVQAGAADEEVVHLSAVCRQALYAEQFDMSNEAVSQMVSLGDIDNRDTLSM